MIRGQGTIKLYVVYNVLEVGNLDPRESLLKAQCAIVSGTSHHKIYFT